MKLPKRKTFGRALGGVLIALLAYLYYLVPVPAQHETVASTTDTTVSGGVAPDTEATGGVSTSPATPTPTTSVDPYASIKRQATDIVQAYYLLEPHDTAKVRQARITALVPASVMSKPDFGVGKTACQDQARIQKQLTERATVTPASVSVQPINSNKSNLWMLVPGKVAQYLPDGKPYDGTTACPSSHAFTATFQWQQKQGGGWQLVHFGNPGAGP
jgi:hypothetical protein